nr:type II toxin-antitoxin system VapB family antitoxin [Ornithinimicrobium cryptoxanthini]
MKVHDGVVTRTNIDLDDELVAAVMARYRLESKRSAVDFALRQLVREPLSLEEILAMRGSGIEVDNEEIEGDWTADE